jgi:hypothetical protein
VLSGQSLWLTGTEIGKPSPKISGVGDNKGIWHQALFKAPGALVWGKLKGQWTLFIADTDNNVIKAYDPKTREVSNYAGDLGGSIERLKLKLKSPGGLAWTEKLSEDKAVLGSQDPHLAVSDSGNGCIRLINTQNDKLFVTSFGCTGASSAGGVMPELKEPMGLAFYTIAGTLAGKPKKHYLLYVADRALNKVKEIDLSTKSVQDPFSFGAGKGLNQPWGIAISPDGYLYVADSGNHRIVRIGLSKKPMGWYQAYPYSAHDTSVGGHQDGTEKEMKFHTPKGLAIDDNRVIYVADTGNHVIRRIAPSVTVAGGGMGGGKGGGGGPPSDVKEASSEPHQCKASTIGGVANDIGFKGGFGTEAKFDSPVAIALGPKDGDYKKLYVVDQNGRTRFIAAPTDFCDDKSSCTYDLCETGVCKYYPFYKSPCDDKNACTSTSQCEAISASSWQCTDSSSNAMQDDLKYCD